MNIILYNMHQNKHFMKLKYAYIDAFFCTSDSMHGAAVQEYRKETPIV